MFGFRLKSQKKKEERSASAPKLDVITNKQKIEKECMFLCVNFFEPFSESFSPSSNGSG